MLYGVRLHKRVWVAVTDPAQGTAKGWRPLIWTSDLARAEKFEGKEQAESFAARMRHDDYAIVPIAGALPTIDGPGTAGALRVAA